MLLKNFRLLKNFSFMASVFIFRFFVLLSINYCQHHSSYLIIRGIWKYLLNWKLFTFFHYLNQICIVIQTYSRSTYHFKKIMKDLSIRCFFKKFLNHSDSVHLICSKVIFQSLFINAVWVYFCSFCKKTSVSWNI